tara:strand:- start:181565 stop:182161 length:597 start_codon:yes stop_codon:yes gene_type:complete
MKTTITLLLLILTTNIKAQLLVDDFTTGTLDRTVFNTGESDAFYQTGNKVLGKTRHIYGKVTQNPYEQSFQLNIKDGHLVITAAYDTRGTVYVNYGHDKNGLSPLNQDLSTYKNLKIEFDGKSTINGIYVSLFTGTSRAVYSSHVQAREATFVLTIPLSDIKKIGPTYTLSKIDYIRFQFDSRSKSGCSMAINKIWFD